MNALISILILAAWALPLMIVALGFTLFVWYQTEINSKFGRWLKSFFNL